MYLETLKNRHKKGRCFKTSTYVARTVQFSNQILERFRKIFDLKAFLPITLLPQAPARRIIFLSTGKNLYHGIETNGYLILLKLSITD